MKKVLLFTFMATTALFSCNKIEDKIKANITPFNFTQPEVTVSVPVVASSQVYRSGEQTYVININQVIKDKSGVDINIDKISKITLEKISLQMLNGDEANNWTNFEYAAGVFNTDKGRAAAKQELYSLVGIDDQASEKYSDKEIMFDSNVNLKDYFNGSDTKVFYQIETKARRATTKEVNIKAVLTYKFQP